MWRIERVIDLNKKQQVLLMYLREGKSQKEIARVIELIEKLSENI